MFFEIDNNVKEIAFTEINREKLTIGCVSAKDLLEYGPALGFDADTVNQSQTAKFFFRSGIEVRGGYTFAKLTIVNSNDEEDYISLYIRENLLLIVDIIDKDDSTINTFLNVVKKYPVEKINISRIVVGFIDALLSDTAKVPEQLQNRLTGMEESVVNGTADSKFNARLLAIKKKILRYYNYYGQITDFALTIQANENDVLDDGNMIFVSNLLGKLSRLSDNMNLLSSTADHIQDAYTAFLDLNMNNSMKFFTVITTIFFPLTIIVGWYGMNFHNMPELYWKYGYLYVILLSVAIVLALVWVGKKKKWF